VNQDAGAGPGSAEGTKGGGGDHAHEPAAGPSDGHRRHVRDFGRK
jgi:hypothetical protein